jgi:hemerythrin-like domain-containing protein
VTEPDALAEALHREHRELDDLFGRFLAAASNGDPDAAAVAIVAFDDALRRHTRTEEERLYPARESPGAGGLAPERESVQPGIFRELRLEHVQIRELSAMMRRLLEEKADLESARRLAPNLARRWDAHTSREERELFGSAGGG